MLSIFVFFDKNITVFSTLLTDILLLDKKEGFARDFKSFTLKFEKVIKVNNFKNIALCGAFQIKHI